MDISTGTFLTRDPITGALGYSQTFNPYIYVRGNPVNITDPSGRFAPLVGISLLAGIGALAAFTIDSIEQINDLRSQGITDAFDILWKMWTDPCMANRRLERMFIGGVIGGAFGAMATQPIGAGIGAVTNFVGGLMSGHRNADELAVDAFIGGVFGTMGGALLGNVAKGLTSFSSLGGVSLTQVGSNAFSLGWRTGLLNTVQNIASRELRSQMFGVNETTGFQELFVDFAVGSLLGYGVEKISYSVTQTVKSLGPRFGQPAVDIFNDTAQRLSLSPSLLAIGTTVGSTNTGGVRFAEIMNQIINDFEGSQ